MRLLALSFVAGCSLESGLNQERDDQTFDPGDTAPGDPMRALLLTLALFTTPSYAEGLPSIDTPPSGLTMDLRADVALIVAVEDYAFLPDVPGARTNALAWEAYLRARGVGTVKLLVDREVSREEVLRAAAAVGAERGSTGRAWLVFIGHGAPGKDDHGALVAMDAQQNTASLVANSVGQTEMLDALGASAGAPVVAVIDACFSGSTEKGSLAPRSMPVRPVETEVPDRSTLLVAAKSTECAGALPGLGRPAFSWLALGALRDADLPGDVDTIAAKLREAEALRKQLGEARERELTAGVSRIQSQAKETWGKLAPLRELGGTEAEAKVKAYVAKYGSIEAEYTDAEGTWKRGVVVAEVKEAEAWLEDLVRAAARARGERRGGDHKGGRTAGFVSGVVLAALGGAAVTVAALQRDAIQEATTDGDYTRAEALGASRTYNIALCAGYAALGVGGGVLIATPLFIPLDGGFGVGVGVRW